MSCPSARSCATSFAVAACLIGGRAAAQQVEPPDPSAPIAPLSDLGVPWPELDAPDVAGAQAITTSVAEVAQERRYAVRLRGDPVPQAIAAAFDAQSVLRANEGTPANAAQIDRRARDDAEVLDALLRADGYYDAIVSPRTAPSDQKLLVDLTVELGTRYTFAEVSVSGTAPDDFALKKGDPVTAEGVAAAQAALQAGLARKGYPFVKVGTPEVVVDHETHRARLAVAVDTGARRRFGAIRVTGRKPPFDAGHVQAIARFAPGQPYDAADIDDLRRALIATGLVGSVTVTPVEGAKPATVDLDVALERAPLRTIAGELGYGTGEGLRVQASWQHRNLIRPEGAVTFRGVAGTREQSLGSILRVGNFRKRDQVLNARVQASHVVYDAYDARTFEIGGSIERQTNIIWQKKWTWSLGGELLASDERDFVVQAGREQRRTYFIAAAPATLAYDGTDDLLDPRRGYRLSGRVSPELSLQGGAFGYARTQVDASGYVPLGDRLTIAGRSRIGTIAGASRDDIAPSRLFYAGGGGSVRGYGYQSLGPRNVRNDPVGGRSLAEFSIEARVRVAAFGGNFGVVPFVDAGNVYRDPLPRFTGLRFGAGLGLRYYTLFGPIRVDVGTPLARRKGDAPVAVYVSLGQAF